MRTPCNLFIANIAAADLGVCLVAAPLRIIENFHGWPFGKAVFHHFAVKRSIERHRVTVTPHKQKGLCPHPYQLQDVVVTS